jgi:hypothetical protein
MNERGFQRAEWRHASFVSEPFFFSDLQSIWLVVVDRIAIDHLAGITSGFFFADGIFTIKKKIQKNNAFFLSYISLSFTNSADMPI